MNLAEFIEQQKKKENPHSWVTFETMWALAECLIQLDEKMDRLMLKHDLYPRTKTKEEQLMENVFGIPNNIDEMNWQQLRDYVTELETKIHDLSQAGPLD